MDLPFDSGAELQVIVSRNPEPAVFDATAEDVAPMRFVTVAAEAGDLSAGDRVLLIYQDSIHLWRVEADVAAVTRSGDGWRLELNETRVWEIDRRSAPRFMVDVPVEIGLVTETHGESRYAVIPGTAINMSASGARISVDRHIPPGAILHVTFQLSSDVRVRALAVTAFKQHEGSHIGVSFVEFLGDGQCDLHEFIGHQAA